MGAILRNEISDKINVLIGGKNQIKLLEAGCGLHCHFNFSAAVYAVGIDISQTELDQNTTLHEKIRGDLQTYPLPRSEFDVAVCWDVIEHLSKPKAALRNIFKAIKPGGHVILGFPNLLSLKGLVTKFTPLWLHVFFYRHIMKYDGLPLKTYLRFAMRPKGVVRLAEENGFSTVYCCISEGPVTYNFRKRWWPIGAMFSCLRAVCLIVTCGQYRSFYKDSCALILEKAR